MHVKRRIHGYECVSGIEISQVQLITYFLVCTRIRRDDPRVRKQYAPYLRCSGFGNIGQVSRTFVNLIVDENDVGTLKEVEPYQLLGAGNLGHPAS